MYSYWLRKCCRWLSEWFISSSWVPVAPFTMFMGGGRCCQYHSFWSWHPQIDFVYNVNEKYTILYQSCTVCIMAVLCYIFLDLKGLWLIINTQSEIFSWKLQNARKVHREPFLFWWKFHEEILEIVNYRYVLLLITMFQQDHEVIIPPCLDIHIVYKHWVLLTYMSYSTPGLS
jgi:hypothetical protein